jgi:hypothetical protein
MNCEEYNFKKMRMNSNKNFLNYTCINLNNLALGGSWHSDFINYVSFYIKACDNSTKALCKSNKEIIKFLESQTIFLSVYTNSYSLLINDFDNPLVVTESPNYISLNNFIGKRIYLNYKKVTVNQDLGIIVPSIMNYSVFGLDHIEYDSFSYELGKNNIIFEGILYFTNKKQLFKIIYIKLQEALANVGGILNFVLLFFGNVTSFMNEHERTLEIINELFNFSEFNDKDKLDKIIENDMKINKINDAQIKNNNNHINVDNKSFSNANLDLENKIKLQDISKEMTISYRNIKTPLHLDKEVNEGNILEDLSAVEYNNIQDENKIIKEIDRLNENSEQQYIFRISYCLLFRNWCCSGTLSKKERFLIKMFRRSQEIVNKQMDVIDYLKFMNEYIFVKCLIFSYPQNLCLKFVEKPKLFERSRFIKLQDNSGNKSIKRKIDLIKYFRSQSQVTEKDKIFYEMVSQDIKTIIQNNSK